VLGSAFPQKLATFVCCACGDPLTELTVAAVAVGRSGMDRELTEVEIQQLTDRIADTAAHIDAATQVLLRDIRLLDASGAWDTLGAATCAHFLNWRIGMGLGTAREKVRVARALGNLPRVDAALAEGRLSYSKVRAITRVATAENEELLLDMAMSSTAAQLEKICRFYRQTAPREASDDERRWVTHRSTDDGMVRISMQLRAEEAEMVLKAIAVSAGAGCPADRVVAMAELVLAGETRAGRAELGSDHDRDRDGGQERQDGQDARAQGEHHPRLRRPVEVMVHIDAATLTGHAHDTGYGISAEVARKLCCDAAIVPVLEERGKTIDVGRRTRRPNAALERALAARDRGCIFPGCTNCRFVDAHHIEHWLNGGEAKLDNLASLCRRCHGLVHEGGFTVEMTDDGPLFRDPRGNVVTEVPERPALERPVEELKWRVFANGIEIDPDGQIPDWDGMSPDYDHIVGVLSAHGGPPAE
jgi:hypothetical protein